MAIHDGDDLKKVRLKIPVSLDDISKLEPGQIVFLDGVVYTGREGVYQRVMSDGYPIPLSNLADVSNVNFHCSPAAAENPDGRIQNRWRHGNCKLPFFQMDETLARAIRLPDHHWQRRNAT